MLSVVAELPIKPECCEAFEAAFAAQAARVHSEEAGTLLYQLAKDPKKPGSYVVIELYTDKAAFMQHGENLAKASDPGVGAMMAGPPALMVMPVVGPVGLKAGAATATMAVVATLPIKRDAAGRFEEATMPLLDEVQGKEDGTLLYCLAKQPQSGSYVFTELYTDMGSIKRHGSTKYFKAAGKRQAPCFAGRPQIQMLATVGSGGAKPTHSTSKL